MALLPGYSGVAGQVHLRTASTRETGARLMAKRLNPHRRLLARQAATLNMVKVERSKAHDAEMQRLQQGPVRSSCQAPRVQLTHVILARQPSWEGRGRSLAKPPKRFSRN